MRKSKPKKRIILPDPKFNDVLVTKFVNNLMMGGKKTIAYKIFYEAIDVVAAVSAVPPSRCLPRYVPSASSLSV